MLSRRELENMETYASSSPARSTALVHLASGIGNIVLATPLIVALSEMGMIVDLLVDGDYDQTADLFRDWSAIRKVLRGNVREAMQGRYDAIIPAVPPFYWHRFARIYGRDRRIIQRPADALFYKDEQEYYFAFARRAGYRADAKPYYTLPVAPSDSFRVTSRTLVMAPGCKTGEMATKRWPYFAELAERFADVAVVGTADDLARADGTSFKFPDHVRLLLGKLTLRETAESMAAAGAVVGNDSGLCHVAGATGVPTVMIFGPTPSATLGKFPPNVVIMRAGLVCEPCWFGERFRACDKRIDCLRAMRVEDVEQMLRELMGLDRGARDADLDECTTRSNFCAAMDDDCR